MLIQNHKKLTIVCCSILVALGLIYGTVYVLCGIILNPKAVKDMIVTQAQKKLTRTFTMGDSIGFSIEWDLSPHLILHDVTIANASWASTKQMLTIKTLELHFSLKDLLFKKLRINLIRLHDPVLNLERNDKQNNWDQVVNQDVDPSNSIQLVLHKIIVRDGTLVYNGDNFNLDKLDVTTNDDKSEFHVELHGGHNSAPLNAEVDIETLGKEFELKISDLQIGNSDLTGAMLVTKDPDSIKGSFTANTLQFKDFSVGSANPSGEYSIPNISFPIAILRGSDFDFSLKAKLLDIAGIDLKNVNITATNNKNVLTINLSPPANIADGTLNLSLTYDMNPNVPNLSLNAKTSTIQLSTVLSQMTGSSPITGSTLDFTVNLQSQGADLNGIVNNLSGKILLVAGPGNITKLNSGLTNMVSMVLSKVITFDKTAASTGFSCGVMNFKVSGGVARANNGIGIEAANVKVLGNGMVDLRNGRIDFTFSPQTTLQTSLNPASVANFNLAQFVEVKGTLSKPQTTVNPSGIIKEGTNALITAGIAGSTGGIGTIIAGGAAAMMAKQNQNTIAPCKTALGSN